MRSRARCRGGDADWHPDRRAESGRCGGVASVALAYADLPQEGVQMPGQRLEKLPEPGIIRVAERRDDLPDEFLCPGLLRSRRPGRPGTLPVPAQLVPSSAIRPAGSAPAHASRSSRSRSPTVTALGLAGGTAARMASAAAGIPASGNP